MKRKELVSEIKELLRRLENLDGTRPSADLETFLKDLENEALTFKRDDASEKPKRKRAATKAARSRKDPDAVANTIADLAQRLRASFASDESFEANVQAVEASGLTKDAVVQVYNSVFGGNRTFPKSVTKQALLNAIRKDRIAKVRAAS